EQIGRAELLGRGLISEFQHQSLLYFLDHAEGAKDTRRSQRKRYGRAAPIKTDDGPSCIRKGRFAPKAAFASFPQPLASFALPSPPTLRLSPPRRSGSGACCRSPRRPYRRQS